MPESLGGRMNPLVNESFERADRSWEEVAVALQGPERSKPLTFPMDLLDSTEKWKDFVMNVLDRNYFDRRNFDERTNESESESLFRLTGKIHKTDRHVAFDDIVQLEIVLDDLVRIRLPETQEEIQIPLLFDYAYFLKQLNLKPAEIADIIQQVNIEFGSPQAVLLGVYLEIDATQFMDIFSRDTKKGRELTNIEPNPLKPYLTKGVVVENVFGEIEVSRSTLASEIFSERYNRLRGMIGNNKFVNRKSYDWAVGLLEGMYKFGKRSDSESGSKSEYYREGSLDLFNHSKATIETQGYFEMAMLPRYIMDVLQQRNLPQIREHEVRKLGRYITTHILKAEYSLRLVRGSVTDKRISHLRDVMKTSKRRGDEQ